MLSNTFFHLCWIYYRLIFSKVLYFFCKSARVNCHKHLYFCMTELNILKWWNLKNSICAWIIELIFIKFLTFLNYMIYYNEFVLITLESLKDSSLFFELSDQLLIWTTYIPKFVFSSWIKYIDDEIHSIFENRTSLESNSKRFTDWSIKQVKNIFILVLVWPIIDLSYWDFKIHFH